MDVFTYTLIVVFFIFAAILSFIDIKHQKIPRFLSFSFIGSIYGLRILGTLLLFLISNGESETGSLSFSAFLFALYPPTLGLVLGLAVFYAVRVVSKLKLGLADVWFSGAMGAFLGYLGWYAAIAISCLFALSWIFSLAVLRKIRAKHEGQKEISLLKTFRQIQIPFIPFLASGSLCALLVSSLTR
ncbi:MAG TPA: prepilin peptidase [Treponemataceae bacterium]|jgi:prepilin signal peptidase PulO-like enzyme (type II secretory pathway)|nr:prepilin peptidase [Treponemataceae bacterium]HQC26722.1 prepilin peptidase [Treponemataceae bacterium]